MKNFYSYWLIIILLVVSFLLVGCAGENQKEAAIEPTTTAAEVIQVQPVEAIGHGEYKFPDQFLNIENPIPAEEESITKGEEIYLASCERCHGITGMGDGKSSIQNDLTISAFSDEKIITLSDGELFYIISNGISDSAMVGWDMFNEELRWHLVNYIRALQQE